jgi:hypothetical protein
MSEGKAADDLRVFDDILKTPPAPATGTVPPAARGTLGYSAGPALTASSHSRAPSTPPPYQGKGATLPPPPGFAVAPPPSVQPQALRTSQPPSHRAPPAAAPITVESTASFAPTSSPYGLSFAEPLPMPGAVANSEPPRGTTSRPEPQFNPFSVAAPITSPFQSTYPSSQRPLPALHPNSLLPPSLALAASAPPPGYSFGEKKRRSRAGLWIAGLALAAGAAAYTQRGAISQLTDSAAHGASASLIATSPQPGVRASIDGRDLGVLPQQALGLTPGEHVVVFEGDHYAPEKTTITLTPGEKRQLSPVSLKVAKGVAKFDVAPANVSLALVGDGERRAITDYSRPIEIDASKAWVVEASKPGLKTVRLPIAFDGAPEKTFTVHLNEADNLAGATAGNVPESAQVGQDDQGVDTATLPSARHRGKRRKRGARVAAAAAAASPAETVATPAASTGGCTLNLNSIPPSSVAVDGHLIGRTPKVNVAVKPGDHAIVFVSNGTRKTAAASCAAGEHKTVALRF